MFKINQQKIYLLIILFTIVILSSFSNAEESINIENKSLKTIEDVEKAIHNNTLNQTHYLEDFNQISNKYDNPQAYKAYLDGVWLAKSRSFESASAEFYNALDLIEDSPDVYLEMLILEKLLEIDEVYRNIVSYQDNAFRLRFISAGVDDQKFIKALFAIADAHYMIYNDETAKTYLAVIFEESKEIDYAYGFSRYHLLYGDMENSYGNFDDAKYHYQKAYDYGLESEHLLSLCYKSIIEMRMARTETYDGQYRSAYDRLIKLLDDIEQKSHFMQREIYYDLGVAAANLELYDQAINYLETALTSDQSVNKNFEVYTYATGIYEEIALAYAALGEYEESVRYFEASHEVEVNYNLEEIRVEQVSALNAYEVDELQRELAFRQRLKEANEKNSFTEKILENRYWFNDGSCY